MTKLTELVRQYKKTKKKEILEEIFLLLNHQLKEKAKWIFYQQNFNVEGKINKLSESRKFDFEDIEQEIKLVVLELIEKYKVRKPFENYLNGTLSHWFPKIMRKTSTRQFLSLISQEEIYNKETGEGINIENFPIPEQTSQEKPNIDEMFINLTKKERILLELMIEFPEKNHIELAELIGVTRQMVEKIIKTLRKKYKRGLHN